MPSPRGTNQARLYLTGAVARIMGGYAYDAKGGLPRQARDGDDDLLCEIYQLLQRYFGDSNAEPAGIDEAETDLDRARVFIRKCLSPAQHARLEEMMADMQDDDPTTDRRRRGAKDEPPPFKGKPEAGGGKDDPDDKFTAMDARARRYADAFPSAAVETVLIGVQGRPRPTARPIARGVRLARDARPLQSRLDDYMNRFKGNENVGHA
jgi:hypothetical protein